MLTLLGLVDLPGQASMAVSLWTDAPPSTARSSADVTIPGGALLYYASIASYAGVSGAEVIAAGALTITHIDRPVAAGGSQARPGHARHARDLPDHAGQRRPDRRRAT